MILILTWIVGVNGQGDKGGDLLALFLVPLFFLFMLCCIVLVRRSRGSSDSDVPVTYLSETPTVVEKESNEWGVAKSSPSRQSPAEKFNNFGGTTPTAYRSMVSQSPLIVNAVLPSVRQPSFSGCTESGFQQNKGLGLGGRKCH